DKNSLDTGTLGFGDIHNQADYKVEHQGGGISTGGSIGQQFAGNLANALIAGGGSSGHAEGTTQAAVSEGTLTVRDTENQKQDVAGLSRDAEHANGSISPIFDKEKEQRRLQEVQLIAQIGNQAADIARTQGEINGLNAGKKALAKEGIPEPDVNASDEEKARYQTQLRNSAAYKTEQTKYGTGSDVQRGIQAAVGALQGLAGGNIGAALAGASAPELANIIGHKAGLSEDDIAAKAIAHAILGGAAAAMQGNNVAAGAAGAAAGELAANAILKTMYPGKHVSELDESDRQLVSNLATIASGLAGNLAGGDSKSTTTGAQSGKNSVENNLLGGTESGQEKFVQEHGKNIASCSTDPSSASCQKGLAMNDALMVALPAGLGGGLLAAATPEIAAAAKVAIQACAGNVVLCLNNAGIQMSEAIVPGGVGAGGAVGIGKTAAEATAAKAETVAANAVRSLPSGSGPKINTGKFGQLDLDAISQTGAKTDSAVKAGNFTVAGRALQKHGSREGSAFPVAKGTPAQMNEQGQKILDGIVKTPGATVKEGNRFGGFDVIAPDGRGARFDPQGNFRGFLEP
ncbi:MAG: VENN motif pre-toxin domain-containing protein, partial [Hafnia sp.]|uniref:VENN motif pre-toxin domain-containing protein n=1 Tax=Hafnia sp. TaxID=1873498 RepID=UPI002FCB3BFB